MGRGISRIARRGLAAWIAVSLGVVCLPSAALCVGDDGHLAIEAVGASCASPGETSAVGSEPGQAEGSMHGCVDTPLGARGLRETSWDAALIPAVAAMRAPGIVPELDHFAVRVLAAPLRPHRAPLALSSVLLL